MGRITATAGLAVVLALALGSCTDITEPDPTVEVRVAHAAPGLGTATVFMNSAAEFELGASETGFFVLARQPVLYEWVVGADTAGLSVSHEADINGVVLMNRADPTLHYFRLERAVNVVRIMVVNGDFVTGEDMTIRVEAEDTTFEDTVAPGDHFLIEPGAGAFDLAVRGGGSDTFVDLNSFFLVPQDHGFLIVLPVPETEPGTAYSRLLF